MPTDTHTDAKGAAPAKTPAPAKKPKPDEEAETPAAAAPRKEKTLPTGLSRAIVIATLVFSLAFAAVELLRDRYAIAPVPNSPNSFVYRLDRLTGELLHCSAQQCSAVQVDAAE
jgi:hypothetical protein